MHYISTGVLTIGLFSGLLAQDFPKLEFSAPQELEGRINSAAEETYPLIAPDKSLYFVRSFDGRNTGGKFTGHDIWQAQGSESPTLFTNATNSFGILNNLGNNAVVGISNDGKRLYLMNSYEVENSKKIGISYTDRTDSGWGAPQVLDIPELSFKGTFYGANVSGDGNFLFLSMEADDSEGKEDLYVVFKKGAAWEGPVPLEGVNSVDREISPFYDSERQLLFFASNRPGGSGDLDIYMSLRRGDGWINWSEAQALPKSVNTENFEGYFSVTKGGDAYLARNKRGDLTDVYYLKMSPVVEEPVVVVDPDTVVTVVEQEVLNKAFANLEFETGKAVIRNTSFSSLDELADLFKAKPKYMLLIEGHTDNVGNRNNNLTLSKNRSTAVKTYLQGKGIDGKRITVKYYGPDKPIADNATEEGRQRNRRVEMKVIFE